MSATAPTREPTEPTDPTPSDRPAAPPRPWFGGLEAIRFGAAFAVILHHAGFASGATFRWSVDGGVAGQLLARLDVGVTVFFVLSGFVLFRPFVAAQVDGAAPPATGPFWVRRAARIYPAYWVALAIQWAFGAITIVGIGGLLSTIGLLQIYHPSTALQGMTQSWTLATEVGFYLLLPGLAWVGRRFAGRPRSTVADQATRLLVLCAALAVFSLLFRAAIVVGFPRAESDVSKIAKLWTPAHLDAFGAGMAIAVLSVWAARQDFVGRSLARLARPIWFWWGLAAAVFWFVATQFELVAGTDVASAEREAVRQTLYVVIGVAILVPAILTRTSPDDAEIRPGLAWLERPVALWLGSLSYGVYLWHQAVISWTYDVLGWDVFGGNFFLLVAITVPASIGFAVLSRRFVEDPVMQYVRRRQGRPRRRRR